MFGLGVETGNRQEICDPPIGVNLLTIQTALQFTHNIFFLMNSGIHNYIVQIII